jgi:hypothetical protein
MGNAVISSLALRPSDNRLVAGTHGYGMWATNLSLPTLPVTLVSFTGKLENDHAALRWETANELNSAAFRVEKSIDGVAFAGIGTLPAAGNSSAPRLYQFTDPEPAPEISYYRLQMIDLDGKTIQSPIIQIRNPNAQQQVFVLNNPFDSYIDIRLNKFPGSRIDLQLTDLSGRLLIRSGYSSMNQMQIRMATNGKPLSSGIYLLQVNVDNRTYTFRVMKR